MNGILIVVLCVLPVIFAAPAAPPRRQLNRPVYNRTPYGSPIQQQHYGSHYQQTHYQQTPYQQPYGSPYQQPYGSPYQQPYGSPYGSPCGQAPCSQPIQMAQMPYPQMPMQQPYGSPYGSPYGAPCSPLCMTSPSAYQPMCCKRSKKGH